MRKTSSCVLWRVRLRVARVQIKALVELLRKIIAGGEKTVVFSQWTTALDLIEACA